MMRQNYTKYICEGQEAGLVESDGRNICGDKAAIINLWLDSDSLKCLAPMLKLCPTGRRNLYGLQRTVREKNSPTMMHLGAIFS